MRKALALSIIITVLGVTAYFFEPSEKECIQKAKEKFRNKISYSIGASSKTIDKNLFAQSLVKNFLQGLEISDKFFYRDIYQNAGGVKNKIGWAALGWVNVDLE